MLARNDTLTIRLLTLGDQTAFCEILSDRRVSGSLRGRLGGSDRLRLFSEFSATERIEKFRTNHSAKIVGKPCYFALTTPSGPFIGSIGSYAIDRECIGLSYWLAASHQGRGIGTEALRLYVPFALRFFDRRFVLANVAANNPASTRALQKAGFKRETERHDHAFAVPGERSVWRCGL